jgi:hypothetical protein
VGLRESASSLPGPAALFQNRTLHPVQQNRCDEVAGINRDQERRGNNQGEEAMTKKEKIAFAQGVEEGFVRAAELSCDPDAVSSSSAKLNPRSRESRRNQVARRAPAHQEK